MSSDTLSVRYWRTLTGSGPVMVSLTGDWQFSLGSADAAKQVLRRMLFGGFQRVFRSRSRSLSHRTAQRMASLQRQTGAGALLEGVQYIMDFNGSKLSQEQFQDPGTLIAESWTEMMREIDEFLAVNRRDSEGEHNG